MFHQVAAVFVLAILLCHCFAMQFVYRTGSSFYKQHPNVVIWDILHSSFPDYSKYDTMKNWYLLLFVIPPLFLMSVLPPTSFYLEWSVKFLLILFLRSITIVTTILPCNSKDKKLTTVASSSSSLGFYDMFLGGGCYDKMFSGHFSFGFLTTLLLFKYHILDSKLWWVVGLFAVINLGHFLILGITRSHYTMDLVVSVLVTWMVFKIPNEILFLPRSRFS